MSLQDPDPGDDQGLVERGRVAHSALVHALQTAGPDVDCWTVWPAESGRSFWIPRHHESDTKVHRGRITKQGSTMVRWAAVESVQRLPKTSRLGAFRDQVADRRGRNIGIVAAARRQVELVYYALRDHHVRALHQTLSTPGPAA